MIYILHKPWVESIHKQLLYYMLMHAFLSLKLSAIWFVNMHIKSIKKTSSRQRCFHYITVTLQFGELSPRRHVRQTMHISGGWTAGGANPKSPGPYVWIMMTIQYIGNQSAGFSLPGQLMVRLGRFEHSRMIAESSPASKKTRGWDTLLSGH